MIEFVKVTKKFKNNFWEKDFFALNEVSFAVGKGNLVGFLGANGAGKTTLIKCLMDFSQQDSGEIIFDPSLGKTPLEIRSSIGYLPERAYLYQHLTGREFLEYVGSLNSLPRLRLKELIEIWSEKIQIDHALDRYIRGYSKGMQQRLGFISALMHEPKFLVLDEPLSGLDPLGRRDFKKIMRELNDSGTTIFFSSHIVSDVEELCNDVVFIEKGKLIYNGSINDLFLSNASDLYTIRYIDNGSLRNQTVNELEKNQFLKKLLAEGKNILELEKEKITLEEIIYKIKK